MNDPRRLLWKYVEERGLVEKRQALPLAALREQLDTSALVSSMEQLSSELNREADRLVVEVQSYLPPEPVVRSFTFQRGHEEFVMQVEIWDTKPTLVFLVRKWRGALFRHYFGWIYRTLGLDGFVVEVKFSALFDVADVGEIEQEKWFVYLLSGLDGRYRPTIPAPRTSVSRFAVSAEVEPVAEA
jgi:hypothetical protein